MRSQSNRPFGPGKSCSKTPQNGQKMHLEAFLEALRRALPVISLVLALKFWSKIDIFHRYLYSDFLKIFSKSAKNRIFRSNFIKNHLFTLFGCFLMKFDRKIRFLADFEKIFKKSLYGTCGIYRFLTKI